MRPIPPSELFSRGQALQFGWSDSALTRAVEAGKLIRVRRGYFADPTRAGTVASLEAAAASTACSGAAMSHFSAAAFHGLPLLTDSEFTRSRADKPRLTVRPDATGRFAHTHLHRATLRDCDVVEVGRILVTSVARTVIDVARAGSLLDGLVCADAALHDTKTTAEELVDALRFCQGWVGARRAQRALEFADARSESPLESVSRWRMHQWSVPQPRLQTRIQSGRGVELARVDFYWDQYGVFGEADGAVKYLERPDALVREKRRQERLENIGLVGVRWGWRDVRGDQLVLPQRLRRAFKRGTEPKDRRWRT